MLRTLGSKQAGKLKRECETRDLNDCYSLAESIDIGTDAREAERPYDTAMPPDVKPSVRSMRSQL